DQARSPRTPSPPSTALFRSGRVWSGAQALARGLVDAMGGLADAIADAASRVDLEEGKYRVRYVEKDPSPFAQFLAGMAGSRVAATLLDDTSFARAVLARTMPETEAQLRFVENAVSERDGAPVKSLAYCFCGL